MKNKDSDLQSQRLDTPRRRAVSKKWETYHPDTSQRPFIDYAWEQFDSREVTSYLLDDEPSFYRHKFILHEGFCAWVACPSRRKLYQDGMVYRIAKAVENAEAPWREGANAFNHSVGETVGRMLSADRRFFEEVYYPMGGPMRILGALSRSAFKRALAKRSTSMLEAVHLMAVFHYHLTNLSTEEYSSGPSKEASGAAVSSVFGSSRSRLFVESIDLWKKSHLVKDKSIIREEKNGRVKIAMEYKLRAEKEIVVSWNKSRASVAYAYAAASIETNPGPTLLHDIIAGRSTHKRHRDLMPLWCGRARYAVESIIAHTPREHIDPFDFQAVLPPVEPLAFEVPSCFSISPQMLLQGYRHRSRHRAKKNRDRK